MVFNAQSNAKVIIIRAKKKEVITHTQITTLSTIIIMIKRSNSKTSRVEDYQYHYVGPRLIGT